MSSYYEQYHHIVEQIADGEMEDLQNHVPGNGDEVPDTREREIRKAFIRALLEEFGPRDKP
jgi:hypothetical protein